MISSLQMGDTPEASDDGLDKYWRHFWGCWRAHKGTKGLAHRGGCVTQTLIYCHICFNPHGGTRLKYLSDILMNTFQAMIQLKVLGDGLHLWYKQAGAYWIKVPPQQHMNWWLFCSSLYTCLALAWDLGSLFQSEKIQGDTVGAARAFSKFGRVARTSLVSFLADCRGSSSGWK